MKITIKKNKPEIKGICIDDVKPGYVFEIGVGGNYYVKALKLHNDKVALLTYSAGKDWFEMCNNTDWKDYPIRILGKLTEIVVEE